MGKGSRPSRKSYGLTRLLISLLYGGHGTQSGKIRPHFRDALTETSVLYLLSSWYQGKYQKENGIGVSFISN